MAIQPFERGGSPRFRLALAAYSFRQYFTHSKGRIQSPPGEAPPIDMFKFVNFCADHNVGAELTSYFFPPDADAKYFRRVRNHAYLRGVPVTGTAIGNDFATPDDRALRGEIEHTKTWIDNAVELGAPHVRVFAGPAKKNQPAGLLKKRCIAALQECCDYAGTKGVFLGLENHGGIVAEAADLLDIVRAVDSPWFGINLDTGNFHTERPYQDLAQCAPYAINVQVKVELRPRTGESAPTDFGRLARILREANYQGNVVLEYEEEADPFEAVPEFLTKLRKHFTNK